MDSVSGINTTVTKAGSASSSDEKSIVQGAMDLEVNMLVGAKRWRRHRRVLSNNITNGGTYDARSGEACQEYVYDVVKAYFKSINRL
jgi:hypothetical protein